MARKTRSSRPRRRWFSRRHRAKKTIPIAPIVGAVGGLFLTAPPYRGSPVNAIQNGDFMGAGIGLVSNLTGYDVDHGWSFQALIGGWTPIVAGIGVHYLANLLGLNRMMARTPSPINKLRI